MVEYKETVETPETEERTFTPIYSYTQKVNNLIAEGKITKPKYRTLSQEQMTTYYSAKDLPDYDREKIKAGILRANEQSFKENWEAAETIMAMDLLSGKKEDLQNTIGNILVTEDYSQLLPIAAEYGAYGYGAKLGAKAGIKAAAKYGAKKLGRAAAGAVAGAAVGGAAGAAVGGVVGLFAGTEPAGDDLDTIADEAERKRMEAIKTLQEKGVPQEKIDEIMNLKKSVQNVGLQMLRSARDSARQRAETMPYVDPDSTALKIVGAFKSFGELAFAGWAAGAARAGVVKKALQKQDRFGRRTPAVERLARIKGGETGTAASLGLMDVEIMGQGALESIEKYVEETGDTELVNYKGDIRKVVLDSFNTRIQNMIEKRLGVPSLLTKVAGKRVTTAYGEWLNGFAQEFTQGEVNDFFEWVKGNQEATDIVKNIPSNLVEGLIGAILQGGVGTGIYTYYHNESVNQLTDIIMAQSTSESPINEQDARNFAESKINDLENEITNNITNEIVDFVDSKDYKGKIFNTILNNMQQATEYQRQAMKDTEEGSQFDDMTEDELAQLLVTAAQDQTDNAVIFALENKIPLAEAPQLKGETVEGTYYIEGIESKKKAKAPVSLYEETNIEKDVKELKEDIKAIKEQQQAEEVSVQQEQQVETIAKEEKIPQEATRDIVDSLNEEEKSVLDTLDKSEDKTIVNTAIEKGTSAEESKPLRDAQSKFYKDRLEALSKILAAKGIKVGAIQGFDTGSFYIDVIGADGKPILRARMARPRHPKTKLPKNIDFIDLSAEKNVYDNLRDIWAKIAGIDFQEQQSKKGGAYDRATRSITLGAGANFTTWFHEFAHYWIDKNFKWARSGLASAAWLNQWMAVEKWLGINLEDKYLSKAASEKFARAYERFLGEEKLPLVLKKAMVDFRDFVQEQYDYELDDARGLQDKLGRPIKLDEAAKEWFRKSIYKEYLTPEERAIFNARLAEADKESASVKDSVEKQQETEKVAQKSKEIAEVAPTGAEIQKEAGVSNAVVLGKKSIGGGEEKQSKGAVASALGKTYESTSWDIQDQLVSDYLATVSIDDALIALEEGTYPDKIDANFLRQALVDKLLEAGRDMEAAVLVEETADDFTQAAQTLQAARRINDPFTNAVNMLTAGKAVKLAEARYGRNKGAVEQLDKAMNALIAKYEKDFMAAETDEERDIVLAAMQDEAINTIGSLDKGSMLEFQTIDTVEDRKQAKAIRQRQKRRASISAYRSRAKRALKQALGLEPSREQIKSIKKLTNDVKREIRDYRKNVRENKASAIDPTSILMAQNKLNEYMNSQLPPRVLSNVADALNSYMMANMLWNPATNVFNIESTWVQMIPHMLATYINYGKGTIPFKEKLQLIKQALALQAKTGYNIFSLRDFFDKKTLWAEKYYEPKTKVGKIQAFPLTMLGLADTANKGIVFLQHADAMATKQAKKEGKGKERARELFYQALNTDPRTITRDGLKIREESVQEGEEATFTQMTRTAELVNKFRRLLNFGKSTGLGNIIMPFTTTISNIAEDTVKNYALGSVKNLINAPKALATQFDKSATAEMKKEAWKAIAPETKSVIKNMIGVLMLLSIALSDADDEDYVLGYERQTDMDKDIRQNRNAPSGYAIRIGNRWIDLDLFGIGSPWAKAYLIAKRDGFTPDGWVKGIASTIDLVPGVSEIQDIYDRFSKVQQWSGEWEALADVSSDKLAEITERLIPAEALFNEIGNITDTSKRVFWNRWYDRALSKIPGLRRVLPERTSSATGETIPQTDVFWNLATGQRVKEYIAPTDADKARYEFALSGKALAYREGNSKLRELGKDTQEYADAVAKVRKSFTKKLESVAKTREYKGASIDEKRKIANKLHQDALDEVKEEYGLQNKKKNKLKKK